ncbi:hypothetical protein [Nostoc sp. FACHB-110]|uniref:hypothetical protein n=1 Tax=Nostoc sp. FACHB-110 TaxID=2692834 RepID=UPI00168A3A61|nr:hypothetical protein [Nostoc sp. FACHB-110]MBD2437391.1 hypothetical protein [Nostoc sp. FACHB-110]
MERLISESQLKEIIEPLVRQILAEMLGMQSTNQPTRQWYDTDQAYSLLGLDYPDQLRDLVRSGILRIGIEVRDVRSPNSQIPRYQFHIEKCDKQLLIAPEKRKISKKIA